MKDPARQEYTRVKVEGILDLTKLSKNMNWLRKNWLISIINTVAFRNY
jgi:hypothetical protein